LVKAAALCGGSRRARGVPLWTLHLADGQGWWASVLRFAPIRFLPPQDDAGSGHGQPQGVRFARPRHARRYASARGSGRPLDPVHAPCRTLADVAAPAGAGGLSMANCRSGAGAGEAEPRSGCLSLTDRRRPHPLPESRNLPRAKGPQAGPAPELARSSREAGKAKPRQGRQRLPASSPPKAAKSKVAKRPYKN
jgi:hypothetical protein